MQFSSSPLRNLGTPLEIFGYIFPLPDVFQQLIEPGRCAFEGICIRARRGVQHLVKTASRVLEGLELFTRDGFAPRLLIRPHQACDSLAEFVLPSLVVVVAIHSTSAKEKNDQNLTTIRGRRWKAKIIIRHPTLTGEAQLAPLPQTSHSHRL